MEQRRLLKTIENVLSKDFESENEILEQALIEIVARENIHISGGRIWKLNVKERRYELFLQAGKVQRIKKGFILPVAEYPIFKLIPQKRTILANETNEVLKKKGIFRYSASGVGEKHKIKDAYYYEYLLAVNSEHIDDALRYTLNIIATVLTARLKEFRSEKSTHHLIKDVDKAKQLQRSILPAHEYSFHNYELFGITIPAEKLGGDFFDYVKIGNDEERLGIVVGDAASKGIAAAAEAMYISGAVRMASKFQIKISPFMYRLNNLVNQIFSDDRFCTLFYGEISNDKHGLFLYANAGHNPPIFYSKKKRKVSFLYPTGPILGPAPNSKYETDSINLCAGDLLVIYSDGIVEAANDKFKFYDEKRLIKIISRNTEKTPKELAYLIIDDVVKFSTAQSRYQDDKTLVIIKRNGKNES